MSDAQSNFNVGDEVVASPKYGDFSNEFVGVITGIGGIFCMVRDQEDNVFACEKDQLKHTEHKMDSIMVCPICGKVLKEDDKLVSHYYMPKNWWVVYHLTKSEKDTSIVGGLELPGWNTRCANAGYQLKER